MISDELRPHAAWATGELHEITMLAKDSKIYPGRKRKVGYSRPARLQRPPFPAISSGKPLPTSRAMSGSIFPLA